MDPQMEALLTFGSQNGNSIDLWIPIRRPCWLLDPQVVTLLTFRLPNDGSVNVWTNQIQALVLTFRTRNGIGIIVQVVIRNEFFKIRITSKIWFVCFYPMVRRYTYWHTSLVWKSSTGVRRSAAKCNNVCPFRNFDWRSWNIARRTALETSCLKKSKLLYLCYKLTIVQVWLFLF